MTLSPRGLVNSRGERSPASLDGRVFPVPGSDKPPRRCRVSGSPAGVVPVKGSDAAAQSAEERRCASADEAVAATRPPGVSPVDSVASVASSRGTTDTNQSHPVPSGRTDLGCRMIAAGRHWRNRRHGGRPSVAETRAAKRHRSRDPPGTAPVTPLAMSVSRLQFGDAPSQLRPVTADRLPDELLGAVPGRKPLGVLPGRRRVGQGDLLRKRRPSSDGRGHQATGMYGSVRFSSAMPGTTRLFPGNAWARRRRGEPPSIGCR